MRTMLTVMMVVVIVKVTATLIGSEAIGDQCGTTSAAPFGFVQQHTVWRRWASFLRSPPLLQESSDLKLGAKAGSLGEGAPAR